jgi:hypothetical protein
VELTRLPPTTAGQLFRSDRPPQRPPGCCLAFEEIVAVIHRAEHAMASGLAPDRRAMARRLRISEVVAPTESDLAGSTVRGMQTILCCPQCGERVLTPGDYTVGRHHARNERSTCPQCHVALVRHPDLKDTAWTVDDPAPPPDEELGGMG